MRQSISPSKISYNTFMITSFLIGLFIGEGSLFRFVDLDESVSIDLEVLESRDCFYNFIVAFSVTFPIFQVFQMNVC